MVRRSGRFASHVRHRVVPDRDRAPKRCNASVSAVNVCRDAPAGVQQAEHLADGGVVYVSRALAVSPSALRINAQHVARFAPIIPATACYQRNYIERYSKYSIGEGNVLKEVQMWKAVW